MQGLLLAGEGHKAAKEQLALQANTGVAKVVGLSKLRRKYEAHEAKRQLCSQFDLFLADDRILPSLPKLIGKRNPTAWIKMTSDMRTPAPAA